MAIALITRTTALILFNFVNRGKSYFPSKEQATLRHQKVIFSGCASSFVTLLWQSYIYINICIQQPKTDWDSKVASSKVRPTRHENLWISRWRSCMTRIRNHSRTHTLAFLLLFLACSYSFFLSRVTQGSYQKDTRFAILFRIAPSKPPSSSYYSSLSQHVQRFLQITITSVRLWSFFFKFSFHLSLHLSSRDRKFYRFYWNCYIWILFAFFVQKSKKIENFYCVL